MLQMLNQSGKQSNQGLEVPKTHKSIGGSWCSNIKGRYQPEVPKKFSSFMESNDGSSLELILLGTTLSTVSVKLILLALIMRNKPDIDEIDIDDLYNNLRVYEDEIKRSLSSTSTSQNLAFLSSKNTSSTNEVSTASGDFGVSTARGISQVSSTPCAHDVACSFFAQLTTSPQLENEDFQQIDEDDLEELDLRWQVAMLTVRVKKFIQKKGRNLDFKEKRLFSLDKSKSECYNCHRKGHFARDYRSGRNQGKRSYGDNGRSNAPTNESSSQALVAQDGLGGYDWSNDFEVEPVKYALMAIYSSSSSSSSDNEGYELALESLESRILVHEKNELAWGEKYESSDEENTLANDSFSKVDGFHVVPPPITGNFLTPRADISFAGLDEYAIRKKIIESKTTDLNTKTSKTVGKTNEANTKKPKISYESVNRDKVIIEDWNSDDEDDVSEVQTVSPVKTNETQTVKTRVDKIGQSLVNPVRPNEKRAVQTINTARPVSTARSVSTARPFAPKTAQTSSAVRPIYPRMDNVRPKKPHIHQYEGNPEICLQDHAVVDSGCSSHMTGNKAYLSDYEDYNRGFVAFGSDPKGGKITGKGKIRTANLDFDDVYFVDELKFNLFMSYHPNKNTSLTEKNSVLFTNTECLILSLSFKLLDENQVVLRAPRQNGVYSLDLKNIVPFGATKDETAEKILCEIIKWLKNAIEPQIKIIDVIRDRVKNHAMNEFYARRKKGSSVLELHSRNGVAERKNKTLIEAARTMLADSLLPIPFWAEAVNTACYVLNRVLVTKPQNKTPYELLIDQIRKFAGYSTTSKAFRVYNKQTKRVEENLHIDFIEYQPNVVGSGPDWMFDLDFLTNTMNYIPVSVENQITVDAGTQESYVAGSSGKDKEPTQEYILLPLHPHRPRIPVEDVIQDAQEKSSENAPNDKGELD
ncbi:ribonuclease H-like domain-containing protein [Tanacetum coccineum]